jgi:hypothetical protein
VQLVKKKLQLWNCWSRPKQTSRISGKASQAVICVRCFRFSASLLAMQPRNGRLCDRRLCAKSRSYRLFGQRISFKVMLQAIFERSLGSSGSHWLQDHHAASI